MNTTGGSGNDPNNYAQNLDSKLGKVLRIRLSTAAGATGYTVPGDNLRGEVWAYGLRYAKHCCIDIAYTNMYKYNILGLAGYQCFRKHLVYTTLPSCSSVTRVYKRIFCMLCQQC
jgi:Glucose / Sorbosone dehydrogenase